MNNKEFIYSLIVLGFLLICVSLLINDQVSGAITRSGAFTTNSIRIRGCDYNRNNVTWAINQTFNGVYSIESAQSNRSFVYVNSSWSIGQITKCVNVTIENRTLFFYENATGYSNTVISSAGIRSNITLRNCSIMVDTESLSWTTLISGSGWLRIENCLLQSRNCSLQLIASSKRIYMTNVIMDRVWFAGGILYLKNVVVRNVPGYTVYQCSVVSSEDVLIEDCNIGPVYYQNAYNRII